VGLEASSEVRLGDWSLRGSALALKARREGASDSAQDGLTPTNVPERSLRLSASAPLSSFSPLSPAWVLQASVSHEGRRAVLPDDSVWLPGWTSWSLGARYSTTVSGAALVWRIEVDNLFDQRAWQESPYQYGHAYLYPLSSRSLRSSLTAQW
jgi:iron complex outermembrane receptor protein